MDETAKREATFLEETQYTIKDKAKEIQFIVKPVFSQTNTQTLGEILLRLIQSDS